MLKVAIVGCGKIADAHAAQIQRIEGCEIVGVCDREALMAKQLYQRFRVKNYFSDLSEMLKQARPDVVHITTPPQGHFSLARQCVESGCHVYIEKPFTLYASEAEQLIARAERAGVKLTAGHDDQFRHAARRMREEIKGGYLGGPPVHMESYYCYDMGEANYAKALLGDREHWVRKLPGQLLHNIISHGIARIAEHLVSDAPKVVAYGFVSPMLASIGEEEIVDELRVIISDDNSATAYFTFSSQMRPSLHQFRIFGPRNGLQLDQDNETLIRLKGSRYKSFAEHFLSPLVLAKEYAGNTCRNVRLFAGNDFHFKAGMKFLIETFYRSITQSGAPLPIPYREIILTARIMDAIFEQLRAARSRNGSESEAQPGVAREAEACGSPTLSNA